MDYLSGVLPVMSDLRHQQIIESIFSKYQTDSRKRMSGRKLTKLDWTIQACYADEQEKIRKQPDEMG